jgi:hypothetical protein
MAMGVCAAADEGKRGKIELYYLLITHPNVVKKSSFTIKEYYNLVCSGFEYMTLQ